MRHTHANRTACSTSSSKGAPRCGLLRHYAPAQYDYPTAFEQRDFASLFFVDSLLSGVAELCLNTVCAVAVRIIVAVRISSVRALFAADRCLPC